MGLILKISKASPHCIWGHVSFLRFTFIYVNVWLYVGAYLIYICDIVCVYVGAGTTEAWRRYPITGAVVIGWDPSALGSGNQNLVFWKSSKNSSPELSLQPVPCFLGASVYMSFYSLILLQFLGHKISYIFFSLLRCCGSHCHEIYWMFFLLVSYWSFTKCRNWLPSELEGLWLSHVCHSGVTHLFSAAVGIGHWV